MRIVPGKNEEFFIIMDDNDVCSFVGREPRRPNPLQSSEPRRVTIAGSIIASCAALAASIQRSHNRPQVMLPQQASQG